MAPRRLFQQRHFDHFGHKWFLIRSAESQASVKGGQHFSAHSASSAVKPSTFPRTTNDQRPTTAPQTATPAAATTAPCRLPTPLPESLPRNELRGENSSARSK